MSVNYEWKIQAAPEYKIREYVESLGVSRILASGLINNNVSIDIVQQAFRPEDNDAIFEPLPIDHIHEAAALLKQYIDNPNGFIFVFGDYDTDGITSTVVTVKGLRKITKALYPDRDLKIAYRIPERIEGYGLSVSFAQEFAEMIEQYPQLDVLVVTVDNGITTKPAVEILQRNPKIKVLVTDHHEPDFENDLTPTNECICVDPHLRAHSAGTQLAGCGVIFNVLQELETYCGLDHNISSHLFYLAAIGTVGDMMSMDLYHICLVQMGLIQLNMNPTVYWIEQLRDKAGIPQVTAKDISFTISPILNSCGQMGNANLALDMLMADDPKEIQQLFDKVYKLYQKNKDETKYAKDSAEVDILNNYVDKHAFIMYPLHTDHPGLVSKVATHLSKQIPLPVIVWAETKDNENEDVISGSARNDTTLPVLQMLREAVRNGLAESAEGHSYAFGVKLYRSKLPELQEFLDKKVLEFTNGEQLEIKRSLRIDCLASTDDISIKTMKDLATFPFAKNLAAPVVLIQGADIVNVSYSKNNRRNVCYKIKSPDSAREVSIWVWNIKPDEYDEDIHTKIDMVGTIERNFMKPDFATLSVIDFRLY